MEGVTFRLRSPIFDHGVLGIPVRNALRRGNGKEDVEKNEFKAVAAALVETLLEEDLNRDIWKASAKLVSGWGQVEEQLTTSRNSIWDGKRVKPTCI